MRFTLLGTVIGTIALLAPMQGFAQEYTLPDYSDLQEAYADTYGKPLSPNNSAKIERLQQDLEQRITQSITDYVQVSRTKVSEQLTSVDTTIVMQEEAFLKSLETVQARLQADITLLQTEENTVYENGQYFTGTLLQSPRLTSTYAELQAKLFATTVSYQQFATVIENEQSKLDTLRQQELSDQYAIVVQVAKFLLFIIAIIAIERIMRSVVLNRVSNESQRYTLVKLSKILVYGGLFFVIISAVLIKKPSLFSSFAIIGAGLAIALQDVVKDIVGWMMILQGRLFVRGNRISIGTTCGEIVDFGPLRTTMLEVGLPNQGDIEALERTGKLLSIPNAVFLSSTLTNHSTTSTFLRSEMKVTITFESDHNTAKEILTNIVEEVTAKFSEQDLRQTKQRSKSLYYIPHRITGNQVYTSIANNGVEFTLRFTVPIGERRPVISELSEKILAAFAKEKQIELAYSTIRYFTAKDDK